MWKTNPIGKSQGRPPPNLEVSECRFRVGSAKRSAHITVSIVAKVHLFIEVVVTVEMPVAKDIRLFFYIVVSLL